MTNRANLQFAQLSTAEALWECRHGKGRHDDMGCGDDLHNGPKGVKGICISPSGLGTFPVGDDLYR